MLERNYNLPVHHNACVTITYEHELITTIFHVDKVTDRLFSLVAAQGGGGGRFTEFGSADEKSTMQVI